MYHVLPELDLLVDPKQRTPPVNILLAYQLSSRGTTAQTESWGGGVSLFICTELILPSEAIN